MNIHVTKTLTTKTRKFTLKVDLESDARIVVLHGPSGSGKTSTLRAIAGMLSPDDGEIVINNKTLFSTSRNVNLPIRKRNVGFVPQDYGLFPHLTLHDNIAFGLRARTTLPHSRHLNDSVQAMLAIFEMEGMERLYPHQLSGGQQQRAAVARALVVKPDILLLDEPFSALDRPLRQRLRKELRSIQAKFNVPILFVTHDLEEAEELDGELVYME